MGLLDDAIREHLDLKRFRGADPSEVAREEQDVLGYTGLAENGPAGHSVDAEQPLAARWGSGSEALSDLDLSQLSQETVELDMRAVLDADSTGGYERADLDPSPPDASSRAMGKSPAADGDPAGELLEWEVPGERGHGLNEQLREESAASHRLFDARRVPAGGARAGAQEPLRTQPAPTTR